MRTIQVDGRCGVYSQIFADGVSRWHDILVFSRRDCTVNLAEERSVERCASHSITTKIVVKSCEGGCVRWIWGFWWCSEWPHAGSPAERVVALSRISNEDPQPEQRCKSQTRHARVTCLSLTWCSVPSHLPFLFNYSFWLWQEMCAARECA